MMRTLSRLAMLRWLLPLLCAIQVQAQPIGGYPNREVHIIVPTEPGGGIDATARLLAQQLSLRFGQSFVVINRSGASGNVGTASVARSAPDGYTLLVTGVGHLASPLMHADPGYDPVRDFEPVAKLANAPNVLVTSSALKDLSLSQLLKATNGPHQLSFASAGFGHTSHLSAEIFMARTGAKWLNVPYRGTAPALRALLAGEVQVMFVPASSLSMAVSGGKAQARAVAHATRLPQLPDLPTLAELGVRGAEFTQWYALFAPAGTPAAVLDALAAASTAAVQSGPLAKYINEQAMEPVATSRTEFARNVVAERDRLSTLVLKEKVSGFTQ